MELPAQYLLAAAPRAAGEELDVALEDVQGAGVIGVGVRVDALPAGLEGQLGHLEVRQLAEDAMPSRRPLALVRARSEDRFRRVAA